MLPEGASAAVNAQGVLRMSSRDTEQAGQRQQQQQSPGANSGATYYAGLLTTDIRIDNKATSADMLKRNLQLAGA